MHANRRAELALVSVLKDLAVGILRGCTEDAQNLGVFQSVQSHWHRRVLRVIIAIILSLPILVFGQNLVVDLPYYPFQVT